jgi:hypothetical protein
MNNSDYFTDDGGFPPRVGSKINRKTSIVVPVGVASRYRTSERQAGHRKKRTAAYSHSGAFSSHVAP